MQTNRRQFLFSSLAAIASAAERQPNFVIILADDLGYGDLKCFGSSGNETPNLDRMAAEGVRFTDCYAPMPYCAPARASLLTGRYPFRHGMWSNPAPDSGIDIGLALSEITLPEALKPKGYKSICIGKWHLGHTPEFLPRRQGFDEYYGIPYSNDMRPVQILHNEEVVQYPVVQGHITRDYTGRALDFIGRNRSNPFLLYLAHAMPHKPLAASEEFYSRKEGRLYADVIRELDWSVGEVLKRLRELQLEHDTLVVFLSDNGPWYGGSTPFRGMKARPWEGGIRVPMIARWPGRIPPGNVSREICGLIDLFPTLCGLAGVRLPEDRLIDGKDILPLLTKPGAATPHESIYAMSGAQLHVIRSGKWKLHVRSPGTSTSNAGTSASYVDPRGPDGLTLIAPFEQARPSQYPGLQTGDPPKEMMLFDLEKDPSEQHDVAAANPDVVKRLHDLFKKMDVQVPAFDPIRPKWQGLRDIKGGDLKYQPRGPIPASPPPKKGN
jgi:arylsulfatase A-like enzyme